MEPTRASELFVPFVTVTRVRTLDDALAEANAVDYGLTVGISAATTTGSRGFLDATEAASSGSTGAPG